MENCFTRLSVRICYFVKLNNTDLFRFTNDTYYGVNPIYAGQKTIYCVRVNGDVKPHGPTLLTSILFSMNISES